MIYKNIEHGFPPVIDKDSEILILGSFPSVKSREENFFYMHPNNRFYPMLEKVFGESFCTPKIDEKITLLKKYHIALYDIVESCDIVDSKDNQISNVKITDVKQLIENTHIMKIILNGKKSFDLFTHNFSDLDIKCYYLPSTSSANARVRLDQLTDIFKRILND